MTLNHGEPRLPGLRDAAPRLAVKMEKQKRGDGVASNFPPTRLNMIKQFSVHRSSASALHSGIHCCTLWPTGFRSEESNPRAAGIAL